MAPTMQSRGRLVIPGETLDDRFVLVEQIAQGGMSTIFKATDRENGNRTMVVKVPLPIFSSGVGSWSIFQREAEIALQLDHPFILKFLPLSDGKRRPYLVTEHVAGLSLADRLSAGPMAEPEALRVAGQLCAAVEHLHDRGFVHYDIKPANVMLCPDGTIRLIDFGMAHASVEPTRFTFTGPGPCVGSSSYVAPEQIRRKRGRKSVDVYGIGVVLYEMLTGSVPFPHDDPFVVASARMLGDPPAPRVLSPRVSRQAEEIALRALRRQPGERYPNAAAMKADLEHPEQVIVSGLCDRLQPVTPMRRALRVTRYVVLVGVVPVVTQIVLFLLLWRTFARRP